MPRASKNNLIAEKELVRLEKNLYSLLSSVHGVETVAVFMRDFLSDEERIMLAKRLALYVMLDLNIDTPTIMNALSISLETVRTHKMRSQRQSVEFKKLIRQIHKWEENDTRLKDIAKTAQDILSIPYKMKGRRFTDEIHGNIAPKK